MARLYFAKISAINYDAGTADISIMEHESQVINDVPFLADAYEMPKIKDTVAVLIESENGNMDKGVIIGPVFAPDNKPEETGKGIFYKKFQDGASVKYDSASKTITVEAEKIEIKSADVKSIDADTIKVGNLIYGTIGKG